MAWEWLMGLLMIFGMAEAQPLQDSIIGYEYLDNDTLYIWNNGTVEPNYYYFGECMNQLSNQPDEQWSLTDKYLGRVNPTGQGFNMVLWGNQVPCVRIDITDNLTYSNNTATNIITWGNNEIQLEMKSHIKTNDDLISQIYRFKSNRNTNFDVWFLFNETNISVSGDSENDFFIMQNKTSGEQEYYNLTLIRELNQTLNFSDADYYPFYWIKDYDTQKSIQNEWWQQNYSWFLQVDKDVKLYVNLGEFDRNEEKLFTKKWIDASCTCSGFGLRTTAYSQYPNGTRHNVGDDWWMRCSATVSSLGGGCTGCQVEWYRGTTNPTTLINKSAESKLEILECPTAINNITRCVKKIVQYGSNYWHNHTINCVYGREFIGTRCLHEYHPAVIQNSPSAIVNITCTTVCNTTYNDGDFNASGDTWCQNEDFKINGSLYVNESSTLTVNNSNILMNLTFEKIFIEALSKIFIHSNSRLGGGI